ncbi:helix-turn-helix domain-containing protein [Virgibacillus sp. Bac332]|uniref:helix-turn-helix domain-containing protein n=1 Tax=Virgibacillus sp. Bac332 TaxID=2419842 RepID=UPI000EF4FAE8|nr:helix-turn-helix transcriptional regulator [Virgibacillus sp. Bac332]
MIEQDFVLGQWLKSKRRGFNYSMRTLSLISGVSYSYISLIENGKRTHPTDEVIDKLRNALDVSEKEANFIKSEIANSSKNFIKSSINELTTDQIRLLKEYIVKMKTD